MERIWLMLRALCLAMFAFITLFVGLTVVLPRESLAAEELGKRFAAHDPQSRQKIDHSAWDRLLKAYVSADKDGLNRFDYAGLKASGLGDLKKKLTRT